MGMAASQVRLLQLTARKNSIGWQLENLSMQKMALSRDMQKVTLNYQNALSSKTLKWSNGSGATYVDLSYANLMRPGSANQNKPYLITNSAGKVVIDNQYKKYAEMISPDGAAGGDYESNRTAILESLTGVSADKIENKTSTGNAVQATEDEINELQEKVDIAQAKAKETATLNEFLGLFGSSWAGVSSNGTATSASTVQQDYEDSSGELQRCWILTDNLSSSKSQLASMINQMCTSVSAYLDTDDAEAFREACDETISNYNTYLEISGEQCGSTCQTSKDTSGPSAGKYVVNIQLLITELLRNYENAGGTAGQNSYGTQVYTWYDKNSSEYAEYIKCKEKLEAAKGGYDSTIDADNQVLTSAEETQIAFYDQIFTAIADKGWVGNSQVSDTDYLNQMLQNNQYYITTMTSAEDEEGEIYYEYSSNIASNFDQIFTVNDSDAQEEAQIEYEYQKSLINEKESRIDTRMQNLQTEQSAITEMIKGIETVRDDNGERNFGIFA